MKITFKNEDSDNNIEEAGKASLERISETIRGYMKHGTDDDLPNEDYTNADDLEKSRFFYDYGSFFDYGLSVDYVMHEDGEEGYLCYQLSCGGPSEEIRFYYSPRATKPYRVEYVYLDWFCGIGFDVTGEEWVDWLTEFWEDCGTVQSCIEKAMEEIA